MWEKLRVIFTIPELRKKIFFTLTLLAIYRVGYHITLPIVDQNALNVSDDATKQFFEKVSMFTASALSQATIFGLGIMPYISASIILQLLQSVWKPLEDLKKEGETGRKKINEYTRYLTVVLCVIQSYFYVKFYLIGQNDGKLIDDAFKSGDSLHWGWMLTSVLIMTSGTVFLMWLGEQIDEYGIGNGISLLIMAGILAQMPGALFQQLDPQNMDYKLNGFSGGRPGIETLVVLAILFVTVILGVVFITQGQRRIPTQSAKHVRGRRVFGGNRNYLPIRINHSGVMPIIFASSLLMLPTMLLGLLQGVGNQGVTKFVSALQNSLSPDKFLYNLLYVVLIYFFCYFWTSVIFNTKEMAENLKDHGTFIPGYRPGKRTADYLEKVINRITYVGAGFLSVVAIVPTIVATALHVDPSIANFYGGTGLLIAVSVAFDLVQKIDSHLVMRNYTGLLE